MKTMFNPPPAIKLTVVLLLVLLWNCVSASAQVTELKVWAKGSPAGPGDTEPACNSLTNFLWTDTKINVTANQLVRFSAWGEWSAGSPGICGPDGYLSPFDGDACFLRDDDHGFLQSPVPRGGLLVGFIGADPHCGNPGGACASSSYFAVGSERLFTVPASGKLDGQRLADVLRSARDDSARIRAGSGYWHAPDYIVGGP